MPSTTSTRPTIEELKALIIQKSAKRVVSGEVRPKAEAHLERESYADHCRRCEGCPVCFDSIVDAEI